MNVDVPFIQGPWVPVTDASRRADMTARRIVTVDGRDFDIDDENDSLVLAIMQADAHPAAAAAIDLSVTAQLEVYEAQNRLDAARAQLANNGTGDTPEAVAERDRLLDAWRRQFGGRPARAAASAPVREVDDTVAADLSAADLDEVAASQAWDRAAAVKAHRRQSGI